jgi:hypothetical protein
MISFRCPKCDKSLDAPPEAAGHHGWCACGAMFVVPHQPVATLVVPPPPAPPFEVIETPEPIPIPVVPTVPPRATVVAYQPPEPPRPRRRATDSEPEESDTEFFSRIKAERAERERYRKAKIRGILLTVIPLVLLVLNCVLVPAACQRVKDVRQQQHGRR